MAIPPCPSSMKTLDKFLKRAKELDANNSSPDNTVLSYYCKKYVVEKAYEKFYDDPGRIISWLIMILRCNF